MPKMIINDFYCTCCGQKMSIPRRHGKQRETGHLKKMYCVTCRQERNFAECNDYTYTHKDFLEEFNKGVFRNGQRTSSNNTKLQCHA